MKHLFIPVKSRYVHYFLDSDARLNATLIFEIEIL